MSTDYLADVAGPSADDLAGIVAEWPLIEAELALTDVEVRLLLAPGEPSPIDWRRLRRAEAAVLRAAEQVANARPVLRRVA